MIERTDIGPEDDIATVLEGLRADGYEDAHAVPGGLVQSDRGGAAIPAAELIVDADYRFEGKSNPDDSSIVLAFHTTTGWKGHVVTAYGPAAGEADADLLAALAPQS